MLLARISCGLEFSTTETNQKPVNNSSDRSSVVVVANKYEYTFSDTSREEITPNIAPSNGNCNLSLRHHFLQQLVNQNKVNKMYNFHASMYTACMPFGSCRN